MKKKILAIVLCVAMLAIAIVGGTMAYFTDNDADVNTFVVGNVEIKQNEEQREYVIDDATGRHDYNDDKVVAFENDHPLVPAVIPGDTHSYDGTITLGNGNTYKIWDETINNELDKFITVTNTGSEEAYIRTIIAFEDDAAGSLTSKLHTLWGGDEDGNYEELTIKPDANGEYVGMESGKAIYWLQKSDGSWLTLNIGGTTYTVAVFTYKDYLEAGETTDPSLMQLWLDPSATNDWSAAVGDQYQIVVASLAVQADGFNDPDIADPASKAMDTAFDLTEANLITWLTATNKTTGTANTVN